MSPFADTDFCELVLVAKRAKCAAAKDRCDVDFGPGIVRPPKRQLRRAFGPYRHDAAIRFHRCHSFNSRHFDISKSRFFCAHSRALRKTPLGADPTMTSPV